MVLDTETRSQIEKAINNAIIDIQTNVEILFDPKIMAELQIKELKDFLLGTAIASVYQEGKFAFIARHGEGPNQEEMSEIGGIIYKNISAIREAISNIQSWLKENNTL
jgi:hypothetical protein